MKNLGQEFLKKYKVLSVLDQKESHSLYEVEDLHTGNSYIAKYFYVNLFSQAIGSVKHQLEVLAADQSDFIPSIFDIGEEGHGFYVVSERVAGYNLSELLVKQKNFDLVWILKLVQKLVEGIQYFYKKEIGIHLLDPKNIFILVQENIDQIEVKFNEWVSASYIEEKDRDLIMSQAIYLAPEQVGNARKKNDIRSDLYSVGVIMYQLLAGHLPFRAKTLNQYMYQQIAQIPVSVSRYNAEVNASINQMVLCLLEKDPNNRYQSAESFLYDIREYLNGNVNFAVKAYDGISKIQFREKDFLPSSDLNQLEAFIERGQGIIVVSGAANTGKSIVTDLVKLEVQNPKNIVLYVECKHQPLHINVLYALLFKYLRIFEEYPLRRQDILRQEVINLQICKSFICQQEKRFEAFFQEPGPGEGLDHQDIDEMDNILRLWQVIGNIEENLVIIIENLKPDLESCRLIHKFYHNVDKMLLCVSCRTEHSLDHIQGLKIDLHKLSKNEILKTLDRVTNKRLEDASNLAQYVYQKSRGNIYLAAEVTNWLFQKEALNYREGRWRINPLVLFELGLPTDVAREIISRQDALSTNARKLITIMAAIEGNLAWTHVKRVAELDGIDVDGALDELTKEQFIEKKITDTLYYSFTDLEIYHHFRQILSQDQVKYYSQKVGQTLEEEYVRFRKEEEAIAMTRYYLLAQNNDKIKQYAFETALFLKNQGKNQEAIEVLKGFLNSLEYQDDDIVLFYNAQRIAGEIYIAEGKIEEAEKTFEELLALDLSSEMRADILEERAWVSFYNGDFQEAFQFVRVLMAEKKSPLPRNRLALYAGIAGQGLVRLFQRLLGETMAPASKKAERNLRKEMNQMIWWISFMVDSRYFLYLVLRKTNEYWRTKKRNQEMAFAYLELGHFLTASPCQTLAAWYINQGMKITEEIGDDHMTMFAYTMLAYQAEAQGNYDQQVNYSLMALQRYNKIKYSPFYGFTMNALIHAYYYLGDYDNMERYNEFYRTRSIEIGDNFGIMASNLYSLQYYRGQAKFLSALECGAKALDLAEASKDYYSQYWASIEIGVTYFFVRNEERAISYLEKAINLKKGRYFPDQFSGLLYPFYAMALCHKQKKIRDHFPEDKSLFNLIDQAIKKTIKSCKQVTYYASSLRAMAEWQALQGNHKKAKKYFLESIGHCNKYKREWLVAINQMSYGSFLAEIGENEGAMQEFVLAEYHFHNLKTEAFAIIARREYENLRAGYGGLGNELDQFQKRLQSERKNLVFTDLIRDLSSVLDYRELIQKIVMVLLEASGAQQIVVLLPNEDNDHLEIEEFYSNENLKIKNKQDMLKEIPINLIKSVQQTKEILALDHAEKTDYIKLDDILVTKHIKSVLVLPICYKNTLKAVCYLENSLSTGIFTSDIVENMKIVASQMAVSMENALLYKIATTDDLTGLYTRKHFDYLFQEELESAKETGDHLGVVFIDIDKFKNINDTYGHMAGDKVLIALSRFLKQNCRVTDIIGRFGGEEIILLLRGTSGFESYNFAERLRKNLEVFTIDLGQESIHITASFGISSYPEHGETRVELINKADTALYRSKNDGRNQVTMAK